MKLFRHSIPLGKNMAMTGLQSIQPLKSGTNHFPETSPIYANQHYSWMDERGVYFASDISGPHFGQYRYDVIHPVTGKAVKQPASGWRYPESTMLERIKQGVVHFGKDETKVPCNKTYLIDTVNQNVGSVKYKDGRAASKKLTALIPKLRGILTFVTSAKTQ